MAAQTTDLFRKTGAGTVTTLAAPGKALSATSITVGATTNYPTDTGLVIAIRVVDSAGELVAGTYTEWNAIVASGTSFTIEAAPVYGSDQVYPAGSTTQVFIPLSSSAHNDLIDGILTHADQDGTLKAGAVDNAAVLANEVVETAKIKDLNVTTAKIAVGAIVRTNSSTNRTITTPLGSLSETIELTAGTWEIFFKGYVTMTSTSNLTQGGYIALSTSTSSISNDNLVGRLGMQVDTGTSGTKTIASTVSAFDIVTLASTTTYTLIGARLGTSDATLNNSAVPLIILARKLSDATS